MPPPRRDLSERFWSFVDQSAGPNACWPWKGSRNEDGYGWFSIDGESFGAHTVALRLHLGRELSAQALHSCDNPACCNPAHLHEGTQADNMREMVERGRDRRRGEQNGRAVLTEEAVRSIRARWRPYSRGPSSQVSLAAEFGVTQMAISKVVRGDNWRSV